MFKYIKERTKFTLKLSYPSFKAHTHTDNRKPDHSYSVFLLGYHRTLGYYCFTESFQIIFPVSVSKGAPEKP